MVLTKKTGHPKKFLDREINVLHIMVVHKWKDIFKKLEKLSSIDDNDDFKTYCSDFEESELKDKGQNKLSVYCRWILTKHVNENLNKI